MGLIGKQKFNPNSTIKSFPLIAMEQFERVILAHNVEFRGGFYMNTQSSNGDVREIYIPDTREVFCNTCHALVLLVKPKFTKLMKETFEKIIQELEELKKEFLEKSSVDESIILGEAFYTKEEDKILLEQYNNKKVEKYQELFEGMCLEFSTHRYWQSASVDD